MSYSQCENVQFLSKTLVSSLPVHTITYTGQPTPDDSHTRHHTRRVVRCKSNARDIFTTDSLHAPSNTLTPSVPLHRSLSPLALTHTHTQNTTHTGQKKVAAANRAKLRSSSELISSSIHHLHLNISYPNIIIPSSALDTIQQMAVFYSPPMTTSPPRMAPVAMSALIECGTMPAVIGNSTGAVLTTRTTLPEPGVSSTQKNGRSQPSSV